MTDEAMLEILTMNTIMGFLFVAYVESSPCVESGPYVESGPCVESGLFLNMYSCCTKTLFLLLPNFYRATIYVHHPID